TLFRSETDIQSGKEEGVLFAIGGEKSGISLFIKEGKFQYAHKVDNKTDYLVADKPIPVGRVNFKLEYHFTNASRPDDIAGTETIFINGQQVGQRSFSKKLARIVSSNRTDGTDVGRDLHSTVSDKYQSPFNFTGRI